MAPLQQRPVDKLRLSFYPAPLSAFYPLRLSQHIRISFAEACKFLRKQHHLLLVYCDTARFLRGILPFQEGHK